MAESIDELIEVLEGVGEVVEGIQTTLSGLHADAGSMQERAAGIGLDTGKIVEAGAHLEAMMNAFNGTSAALEQDITLWKAAKEAG